MADRAFVHPPGATKIRDPTRAKAQPVLKDFLPWLGNKCTGGLEAYANAKEKSAGAFEITRGQETLSSRKAVRIIDRDSEHSGMRVLEQEQQM
jgi:hypothetical protein